MVVEGAARFTPPELQISALLHMIAFTDEKAHIKFILYSCSTQEVLCAKSTNALIKRYEPRLLK